MMPTQTTEGSAKASVAIADLRRSRPRFENSFRADLARRQFTDDLHLAAEFLQVLARHLDVDRVVLGDEDPASR